MTTKNEELQEQRMPKENPFWKLVDAHMIREESGMRTVRGQNINLVVCNPNMQKKLWGFVTRPMERDGVTTIVISSDIPESFRGYVAHHELNCFANLDAHDGHHCVHASESELSLVPTPDRYEYARMRLQFFQGLLAFYAQIPLPSDEAERVKAESFRRNMQESLVFWEHTTTL